MKEYNTSIFIFRRDFHLDDNIGLINALQKSEVVIPIFILTPEQLIKNKYKSDNCVQFMMESLDDLNAHLHKKNSKLFFFFDTPHIILHKILQSNDEIDAVFLNRDYTPYSKERDLKLQKICEKNDVVFEGSYEDSLLYPVGSVRTGSSSLLTSGGAGTVYTKFTPYFNAASKHKVNDLHKNNYTNYISKSHKIMHEFKGTIHKFYEYNRDIAVKGGRNEAIKILKNIKKFKKYNKERNYLNVPTTKLSAYIKFGCVSIREVYHVVKKALGTRNDLIKQLYWREFYYNVLDAHPNTLSDNWKEKNLKSQYKKVPWITYDNATTEQKKQWKAWKDGKTGYPIVDACMHEMNTTGFMHNRGRMIVSSFLVKNMFWHYAEGEKYFAQHLVDYDPANNLGGWGWISGSHADTQPFFRVFSPILQSMHYDPDCLYIKKWLPELKNVPNDHIHEWQKYYKDHLDIDYSEPILDYSATAKKAIDKYKKVLY